MSSTYIFHLDKLSLEMLVEISPLGLAREFYLGVLGILPEGFVKLCRKGGDSWQRPYRNLTDESGWN
ncbi:hypothetical protein [Microcoleus sp. B4-C1]|uniref:hypothetical protein n=1 Tax=Microcoleus sp. B4-C1 TaxID=2818660 RepID=UPI002FCEEED5